MTIVNELQRIENNIDNSYTALEEKGATIPTDKNSDNLASTIEALQVGGDDTWIVDVIEGETTDLVLPSKITKIRSEMFSVEGTAFLTSISGEAVEEVGKYTIYKQDTIKTINLPNCKIIGEAGLVTKNITADSHTNNNLETVILGQLENIGNGGLKGVFKKSSQTRIFSFNNCVIGQSAFVYNSFSELDLSGVKSIGQSAFYNNQGQLRKIWMPKTIETITASNNYANAPFSGVASGCTIYTDVASVDEVPATWGVGWKYSRGTELNVVYGATHEDFLNA